MRLNKVIALLTAICIYAGIGFMPIKSEAQTIVSPVWSQTIINDAVGYGYLASGAIHDMSKNPPTLYNWSITIESTSAMYMLALMSYHNPNSASTSGVTVSARLLQHIRHLITGGKEPACTGGNGGWVDNSVAQALVLAKNTPAVWNALTSAEKEKCDFIMKALVVVGNYTLNSANNPVCDLTQQNEWHKEWNPNLVEGYVGVMIAGHIYFGGEDAVNAVLLAFDYDSYIQTMNSYGYINMKYCFEKTGKTLLEVGGKDAGVMTKNGMEYGTLVGAKRVFEYTDILTKKKIAYDPMVLYESLARRMYYHACQSKIYDGTTLRGWIADGTTSPFEGMNGMGFEMSGTDGDGLRTDIGYIHTGWRNSVITRATLQALGYFHGSYAKSIQMPMYVGTEDFLYKARHGYIGYEKGKQQTSPVTESSFQDMGYRYHKEIWEKYLKPSSFIATTTLTKSGGNVRADIRLDNNFTDGTKTVIAYLGIYRGDKLENLYSTTVSISSNNKTIESANDIKFELGFMGYGAATIPLPAGCTARLMVFDADNELSPLSDVKEIK